MMSCGKSSAPAKASYTCITCSVAFVDPEVQREHYKGEWHRYNLKRKVAEMNPVTEAAFKDRTEAKLSKSAADLKNKDREAYCAACSKQFANVKALQNHLGSKKHLEMADAFDKKENKDEIVTSRRNRRLALEEQKRAEQEAQEELLQRAEDEGMEIEEVDSDEWEDDDVDGDDDAGGSWEDKDPIPTTDCLFCLHHSANVDKNVMHMSTAHSFFVPDVEYLTNLQGLLQYLGAKVGQGNVCLWCNEKGKSFRSASAVQKHMVDKGHCKIQFGRGDHLAEFSEFYDYSSSYPDDASAQDGAADPDAEVDVDVLDDSGFELVLPSGARIGHRSLFRYFRQNLPAEKTVVARSHSTRHIQTHYKSLGWTGLTTVEARRKAKDIKFMHKIQQKQWMKLGTKSNKLQKHWRDPTMLY